MPNYHIAKVEENYSSHRYNPGQSRLSNAIGNCNDSSFELNLSTALQQEVATTKTRCLLICLLTKQIITANIISHCLHPYFAYTNRHRYNNKTNELFVCENKLELNWWPRCGPTCLQTKSNFDENTPATLWRQRKICDFKQHFNQLSA